MHNDGIALSTDSYSMVWTVSALPVIRKLLDSSYALEFFLVKPWSMTRVLLPSMITEAYRKVKGHSSVSCSLEANRPGDPGGRRGCVG